MSNETMNAVLELGIWSFFGAWSLGFARLHRYAKHCGQGASL
jgi:hypothetical protein